MSLAISISESCGDQHIPAVSSAVTIHGLGAKCDVDHIHGSLDVRIQTHEPLKGLEPEFTPARSMASFREGCTIRAEAALIL